VRVEIGAGERPDPGYEVHTDVLPLPGVRVLCRLDRLPFADGTVTAGNASGVNDGAAAIIVASEEAAKRNGFTPRARVLVGVVQRLLGHAQQRFLRLRRERAWLAFDVEHTLDPGVVAPLGEMGAQRLGE